MEYKQGKLIQQVIDGETGEVMSTRDISKNSDFVMFFRQHLTEIAELNKKDAKAGALFLFFCQQMDQSNALVCSIETLGELNGMAVATVHRKIKVLKDNGFIDVQKTGTANVYFVNSRIAWTSARSGREFAKFKANVILSAKEQEKKTKGLESLVKTKWKTITLKTQTEASKQKDLPLEDDDQNSQTAIN